MEVNQQEPEGYFTIRLPQSIREKLDVLAKKNERSAAAEARIAIRRHLAGIGGTDRTLDT